LITAVIVFYRSIRRNDTVFTFEYYFTGRRKKRRNVRTGYRERRARKSAFDISKGRGRRNTVFKKHIKRNVTIKKNGVFNKTVLISCDLYKNNPLKRTRSLRLHTTRYGETVRTYEFSIRSFTRGKAILVTTGKRDGIRKIVFKLFPGKMRNKKYTQTRESQNRLKKVEMLFYTYESLPGGARVHIYLVRVYIYIKRSNSRFTVSLSRVPVGWINTPFYIIRIVFGF